MDDQRIETWPPFGREYPGDGPVIAGVGSQAIATDLGEIEIDRVTEVIRGLARA